jgi:hypothetical protein
MTGVRCAHGDRGAGTEAAEVEGAGPSTSGGVSQSAAAEHQERQGTDETARGADRKKLHPTCTDTGGMRRCISGARTTSPIAR